ncbi:U6 snRNA phosphodiesterase 1 [Aplochiton taeniatus]
MLVGYSSSSEDESEASNSTKRPLSPSYESSAWKKSKVDVQVPGPRFESEASQLSLPVCILEVFTEKEEEPEDGSQHGGRIRSFKHENGNWATYVYLPYFPEEDFEELLAAVCAAAAAHGVVLTQQKEFHVSLSQTVVLRHHWIQPFTQLLKKSVEGCSRFVCSAQRLRVYANAEKTRTFLGMEVTTGQVHLLELMKLVDEVMVEFSLDTFYKNPSFHVSLAWCIGDFSEQLQKCLQQLQHLVDDHEDGAFWLELDCRELHCRAGNKAFSFPLET